MTQLVVDDPGWATSVQDGGRPGYADVGVPPSGALDGPLRDLLNRLVGNPADAAVLETLGGLRVRATAPTVVATSSDRAPVALAGGETLAVGPRDGELWGYLAVRGGLAVDPVLGSRSRDSRSGLGPPPITAGTVLPIGPDPGMPVVVDQAPPRAHTGPIGVWPGPRIDWFAAGSLDVLTTSRWSVSDQVSRVGARLDGPPVVRAVEEELPSEGVLTGAVQVPPDGRPVVMLADHPTTGGYPVLAVVDPASLPAVVQARPGAPLRFRLLQWPRGQPKGVTT
jgi:biotin-dependent carboxylase-like uncharacterized protein